jgi:hypothetical protein
MILPRNQKYMKIWVILKRQQTQKLLVTGAHQSTANEEYNVAFIQFIHAMCAGWVTKTKRYNDKGMLMNGTKTKSENLKISPIQKHELWAITAQQRKHQASKAKRCFLVETKKNKNRHKPSGLNDEKLYMLV